jgi:hypothetical protein
MEVALSPTIRRRLGRLACAAVFLVQLQAFAAADAPIDRMEASTVRVIVQNARGQQASGSGFVVGNGSFVVTNHHVVEGAEAVMVVGKDLKIPVRRVVADDPQRDLAILQLTRNSGRPPVLLGLRSGVRKTQTVLAAGFPSAADDQGDRDDFLEVKFSRGIVSAFVKSQNGTPLYQIDAPINPGNSGGPLFDECGSVIGIDAMKSLRPAVVVGPGGRATEERLPYGEGVAWAIQSDELLPVMRSAGIEPAIQARVCGAAESSAVGPAPTAPVLAAPPADSGPHPVRRDNFNRILLVGGGVAAIVLVAGIVFLALRRPGQPAMPTATVYAYRPETEPNHDVRLLGVSGSHAGMEFPVSGQPIVLGRDPHVSQIVFDAQDSVVSKRHCMVRIDRSGGGLLVEDCGSTNGTFLDSGERLRTGEPRLVQPRGSFYLGDRSHVFQVKI